MSRRADTCRNSPAASAGRSWFAISCATVRACRICYPRISTCGARMCRFGVRPPYVPDASAFQPEYGFPLSEHGNPARGRDCGASQRDETPRFRKTGNLRAAGNEIEFLRAGRQAHRRPCPLRQGPNADPRDDESFGPNSPYWRDLGCPWGGMHSNTSDLAILLETFLDGGSFGAKRILSTATVQAMTSDQNQALQAPWGLGWALGARKCGTPSAIMFRLPLLGTLEQPGRLHGPTRDPADVRGPHEPAIFARRRDASAQHFQSSRCIRRAALTPCKIDFTFDIGTGGVDCA